MVRTRDNVALIYGVGELTELLGKSRSLEDFLAAVTVHVAKSIRADVCSIYLFEEDTQDLVLCASRGLPKDAVGRVRLHIGEGITGLAMKELRSIVESRVTSSRVFKFIPGVDHEKYQSFLALPIIKGVSRIGVLVLQHTKPDYFTPRSIKGLRVVATQLAMAIENARLLMTLHRTEQPSGAPLPEPSPKTDSGTLRFIKAKPASEGITLGTIQTLNNEASDWLEASTLESQPFSIKDFERALRQTEEQLIALQQQLAERLTDTASLIFSAHLLILNDSQFSGEISQKIKAGTSAPKAIREVMETLVGLFNKSSSARIREKADDLKDLCKRIMRNLLSKNEDAFDLSGTIIIASNLLPSEMLKLVASRVSGIILINAGATAHITILARSLGIPMVIADPDILQRLQNGIRVLLDANQGNLFLQPDETILHHYQHLLESPDSYAKAATSMTTETITQDGIRIRLLANINLLSDLKIARKLKAEGVGLYRTEFPFLIRNDFPSEDDQYKIYCKINDEMGDLEVVFRTLDIGGDKMLSYFPHLDEANPFLGLRAIRFSLTNRQVFTQQLRALLRSGFERDLKIMFPLVSSVDDFILARTVVMNCCQELKAESIRHNNQPKLGVMIELPSAVAVVDELAYEADFLSIGTNDLIQYTLAVDRTNKQISGWYLPHHPAVLRSIKQIVDAARKHNKPLSLCGDMAAEPRLLPFLLGVGVRVLSLQPTSLPKVQAEIQKIHMDQAKEQAATLLKMGRVTDLARFLDFPPPWHD